MKRIAFVFYAVALALVCAAAPSAPAQEFQPGGGKGKKGLAPALPASLHYLTQKAVADDLKVSEKQAKQVADLREKYLADAKRDMETVEEYRKKIEALATASEKDVAELLDAAQKKRLKQIVLRQPLSNGRDALAFTLPAVVKELKLTEGQTAEIKSIEEARRKAMLPLFLTGEPSEEIAKKVASHKKESCTLLLAVLKDGQQTQLKELLGDPVPGFVSAPRLTFPGNTNLPKGATAPAYLTITGVLFADNKILQDELKLTEAQAKRLIELRDQTLARTQKIRPNFRDNEDREKQRAQHAKDNEKTLAEILEPKQVARLHQLVLQSYVNVPAATFGSPSGPFYSRFVEVVEGLKLTKDQQAQIQKGTEFAKVLDAKQQAMWKEMLGEPFAKAAELAPGGFPKGFPNRPTIAHEQLQYLQQKSVQEDLKLSETQIKKLPELEKTWLELAKDLNVIGGPGDFAKTIAERNKKLAEARASLQKSIASVLDAKQGARLEQIELQQLQKRSQRLLLTHDLVRRGLNLSEEQIKKIADITKDENQTQNLVSNELSGGFVVVQGTMQIDADYSKISLALSKITAKKLDAVLTAQQHETVRAMLGAPFMGDLILPKGGFGFGGGFGGGGIPQ